MNAWKGAPAGCVGSYYHNGNESRFMMPISAMYHTGNEDSVVWETMMAVNMSEMHCS